MIAIIDYGLGNVKAFANVYKRLNIPVSIARQAGDFQTADKIILPGVGAFDYAMTLLEKSGMKEQLTELVIEHQVPVLGICVGMQMLAASSEEGKLPGLGWIDGEVKKFKLSSAASTMRIPHMGWNNINPVKTGGLMDGLDHNSKFYFLHSYYFKARCPENVIAITDYDGEFTCAVGSKNIYGVQFHPEKSHGWGVRLLENFSRL